MSAFVSIIHPFLCEPLLTHLNNSSHSPPATAFQAMPINMVGVSWAEISTIEIRFIWQPTYGCIPDLNQFNILRFALRASGPISSHDCALSSVFEFSPCTGQSMSTATSAEPSSYVTSSSHVQFVGTSLIYNRLLFMLACLVVQPFR